MGREFRAYTPFDPDRSLTALRRAKRRKPPNTRLPRPRAARDILEAMGGLYGPADKAVPARLLLECRAALGVSRLKLSRMIGIASVTLGKAERGETTLAKAPRLLLARHIAALAESEAVGSEHAGTTPSQFWRRLDG